ncbi:MAG: hypothetical protein K0S24_669 [Sphingobacterium sp.]|jgi:hypothetical protein|nr:hypothetical protein [Sphingobacterium sp.]
MLLIKSNITNRHWECRILNSPQTKTIIKQIQNYEKIKYDFYRNRGLIELQRNGTT